MTVLPGEGSLSESNENYLETILEIESQPGMPVRSGDIATHRQISRASVSKAMHLLGESGMVNFDRYGQVSLTSEGRRIAAEILERHQMIKRFLIQVLGVEESVAESEACRMEHAIGSATKRKWMAYLRQIL